MSFLLDTGPGMLILTLIACALVVAGTTIAATFVLAVVVECVRLIDRRTRSAAAR